MPITRILFVCMGNICRSPAADIVMTQLVKAAGLEKDIIIDSAATHNYHPGDGPDPRMAKTLRARGYGVFGAARHLRADDFERFDLILPMDQENLRNVHALDPGKRYRAKVKSFASFCGSSAVDHIPDPYYGDQAGFEHVVDLVEDGCGHLLTELRGVRPIRQDA